jgi:hypothetical protein
LHNHGFAYFYVFFENISTTNSQQSAFCTETLCIQTTETNNQSFIQQYYFIHSQKGRMKSIQDVFKKFVCLFVYVVGCGMFHSIVKKQLGEEM